MLSIENNELLTRVGPGTPMGTLMRHYWQPVCAVDELLRSPFRTKEVKVLGEELVVYRDRRGHLGVVDKYCTHRRASLAYGVVENDGIRCQYHGWKFDASGRCVEQPFEDTTHPEDNFRDKCGIRAYKAQELGGLIFVYMGPAPAPLLPRWGPLVWDNTVRDIAIAHLPCSWLQCQENSLDTTHVEHLHGYAGRYFKQILAGEEPDFQRSHRKHTMIGFDAFKYGIIKRRVVEGQDESHTQWRLGHPILFPNILWVGSTLQFRVPADDTHTLHISLYTWRAAPGKAAPPQEVVPSRIVPLLDEQGQFTDLDITFNQDYMCWVTQGDIARRHLEKLGESDRGIILFRKMLLEQVNLVYAGQEPTMNIFRDPAENDSLDVPVIPNEGGKWVGAPRGGNFTYHPQETGYSRDADKIEAVMATWKDMVDELRRHGL
jgi:5,5'-dehydrodivanillate O-demethylase oxygenase subunit